MRHKLLIIRAPPPIKPGFYKVTYRQGSQKHVVHMQLGKHNYLFRLTDFAWRNDCVILSKELITDTKKIEWRKA